jgi:hypothetical protein
MTPEHFQSQVVSALKGIEKSLKETTVNLGLRQGPVNDVTPVVGPEKPLEIPSEMDYRFTLSHVCLRSDTVKLMPYPRALCSMCKDPKESIDLFVDEKSFESFANFLKGAYL